MIGMNFFRTQNVGNKKLKGLNNNIAIRLLFLMGYISSSCLYLLYPSYLYNNSYNSGINNKFIKNIGSDYERKVIT